MEDPTYVTQLKDRWAQYRSTNYSIEHIEATIDSITTLLSEGGALERDNITWEVFDPEAYEREIDMMKQWIRDRVAWMDSQLGYDPQGIASVSSGIDRRIVGCYDLRGIPIPQSSIFNFQSSIFKDRMIIVRYSDGYTEKVKRR